MPQVIDYTNLQFPSSMTVTSGQVTQLVYGRIFEAGVTPAAGASTQVIAQLGYGPAGTNPATDSGWVWVTASFNTQVGNDDEYAASFTAPLAGGQYSYTYRFALVQSGVTSDYTYADLDGAGTNAGLSFDPTKLGTMTVDGPPANPLSIGNLVWNDTDGDGVRDAGEAGIAGVALTLFKDVNANGTLDVGDTSAGTTVTNASGAYSFTGLAAGDYIVRVDAANFSVGGALAGKLTSSGGNDPDDNVDNDDNGRVGPSGSVVSGAITLTANAETSTDGWGLLNINNTVDFGFVAVNQPPVNTKPGTQTINEDATLTFTGGNAISVNDPDVGTGNLTVTLSVLNGRLTLGGTAGLVFSEGDGTDDTTMTFSGTQAAVNSALNGLLYHATGDKNGSDTLTITTNDNGNTGLDPGTSGGASNEEDSDTVTINITAVADAVTDTVTVAEDGGPNNLNLLGNDTFENPGRAITSVGGALHGTTSINNNGTAGDPTDDFVVYTPAAGYNGADSFTYTVSSGGVTEVGTVSVTVTAVNDPVTGTAPVAASLNEDTASFAVTGMSIADVDTTLAPAGVYEVTLSSTHGTMSLTTLTGLTFTSGDGTVDSAMTFHGTLDDINTALATARYSVAANYNGTAQIALQVTDTFGGIVASGSGAATSDSDIIAVTVNSVNDEPLGADQASAATEGATYTFTSNDFSDGFSDPTDTPANLFDGVRITTLPGAAAGTIFLNGVAISAGDVITRTQLDEGRLTFVAAAGAGGTQPTFTFQVRDNGGASNGGVEYDQTPNTYTLSVSEANVAPVLDLDGNDSSAVGTGYSASFTEGGAAAAISDSDISISDANAGDDIVSAVVSITNPEAGDQLNVGVLPSTIVVSGTATNITFTAAPGTSADDFELAIRSVTYSNSSDDPTDQGTNVSRTISIIVNDGGHDSNTATATISVIDTPERIVRNDFNGDGRSDILWRSDSGHLSNWLGQANGGFAVNDANALTAVSSDWRVVATGDFNGDNRSDIIWRNDNGAFSNWLGQSNGGFIVNDAHAYVVVPLDWDIVGTGDFNGDGRDDVLWRSAGGQVSNWLGTESGGFDINDANALSYLPANWVVSGTGDFNGDGYDDILWRSDSGQLWSWLGTASGGFANNDANAITSAPANWHVAGTGDFNGDGYDDILWRSDSGQLSNWLGTASDGFVNNDANAFSSAPTSWQVVAVGDYNGDGFDDILWRSDTGQLSNWLGSASGGFTNNDANAFAHVPMSWEVQPADSMLV